MAKLEPTYEQLTTEEAKKLLQNYRHFLSTPNVVSLDYCGEKVDGKKTGRKVLRIGVIRKLPPEQISKPDVLLPKSVEHRLATGKVDIPVKVVEEGVIEAISAPYKGGSQIYTEGVDEKGSLGVNTNFRGEYRLLSCAHVLTRFDRSNVGKNIKVRSNSKENWSNLGSPVENQVDVTVYNSANVPNPVYAKQDLAWAKVTTQQGSPDIEDFGPVGPIRPPTNSDTVKIYGGATEAPEENIDVDSLIAMMILRFKDAAGNSKYVYFEDVGRIEQPLPFGPGDSGSAVIAESDNAVVGLLFSMGMLSSHFCKLY